MKMWLSILLVMFATACAALTPTTYLTASDRNRIKGIFSSSRPFNDLLIAHYALLGQTLLGEEIKDTQEACKFLKTSIDAKSLESIFHASAGAKLLKSCQVSSTDAIKLLQAAITEEATVQELYYASLSLNNLGQKLDSPKVSKALTAALKKDDSLLNLGYAFHVASILQGDLKPFYERIEDAIIQADEVDGKNLQFEGGLGITAVIISGVFRLSEASKKAPALTSEQAVKFTNYFLSRKFIQTVKGAAQLLEVLKILTENKYHIPVAVTLASSSALSAQNPIVQVRVTNVLGATLGPLSVVADKATRLEGEEVVLTKKPFQQVQGDSTLYALNFMESKPPRGFYKLSISAMPSATDSRLAGNTGAEVQVKVLTDVAVENVEVGTVDRDQATAAKVLSVEFGKKLSSPIEADYHQKVVMKFNLRDKIAGDVMTAHQTFVQLRSTETKQEITFVAEHDSANIYRFDLDIYTKAKEFNHLSGKYEMSLIVGDAVIANPFVWQLGEFVLTFPANPNPVKPPENLYAPKPEIKHIFKEQVKRPSSTISNTFTGLVAVPLLLLFILWAKIGINVSNFPFSLSAVGFHLGLAAIFSLFGIFWLQLNMFQTLRYLSVLAIPTFFSGHRLLIRIASSRK